MASKGNSSVALTLWLQDGVTAGLIIEKMRLAMGDPRALPLIDLATIVLDTERSWLQEMQLRARDNQHWAQLEFLLARIAKSKEFPMVSEAQINGYIKMFEDWFNVSEHYPLALEATRRIAFNQDACAAARLLRSIWSSLLPAMSRSIRG